MAKLKNFKIDELQVIENMYNNKYSYTVKGKMSGTFTKEDTDMLSRSMYDKEFQDSFSLDSDEYSKRPSIITDFLNDADYRNVQAAIDDYVDVVLNNDSTSEQINFIKKITGYYLTNIITNDFLEQKLHLKNNKKVIGLEYDYKSKSIKTVSVKYQGDNNSPDYYETINLRTPVTNDEVQDKFPGMNLMKLYLFFEEYLKEDYNSTVKMANEIFGFNLENLKGADVR